MQDDKSRHTQLTSVKKSERSEPRGGEMSEQADSFAPQNAEHANVSAFTRREKEPQAWKRNAHANAWAIVSVALRRRWQGRRDS